MANLRTPKPQKLEELLCSVLPTLVLPVALAPRECVLEKEMAQMMIFRGKTAAPVAQMEAGPVDGVLRAMLA